MRGLLQKNIKQLKNYKNKPLDFDKCFYNHIF